MAAFINYLPFLLHLNYYPPATSLHYHYTHHAQIITEWSEALWKAYLFPLIGLFIEDPLLVACDFQKVLADSKTFVDCIPRLAPAEILSRFQQEKDHPCFDFTHFVH